MARESKIELGELNNAQVEWSEESGKLTLTIDTNEYDMSGLDITNLNSVSTEDATLTTLHDGRQAVNAADPADILSGSNIAEKINDAFTLLSNNYNTGTVIVPSPDGAFYEGGTEPITIPRSPEGQGYHLVGRGSPEIRWDGSMSSTLVELPPGTTEQRNVVVSGLELTTDGGASVPFGLDLADLSHSRVEGVSLGLSGRVTDAAARVYGDNLTASRNRLEQVLAKPGTTGGTVAGIQVGEPTAGGEAPLTTVVDCEVNGDRGIHLTEDGFQSSVLRGGISNSEVGVLCEAEGTEIKTRWEGSFGSGGDTPTPLILRADSCEVVRYPQSFADPDDTWIKTIRDEGLGNKIEERGVGYYATYLDEGFGGDAVPDTVGTDHTGSGSLGTTNTAAVALDTGGTANSTATIQQAKKYKIFSMQRAHFAVRPQDGTNVVHRVRMRNIAADDWAGVRYDTTSGVSASNWLFEAVDGGADQGASPVDSGVPVVAGHVYEVTVNAVYDASADTEYVAVGVRDYNDRDQRATQVFDYQLTRWAAEVEVDNSPSSGASKQLDVHRIRRRGATEGF